VNNTSYWIVHILDRDGDTTETAAFKTKEKAVKWITKKRIVNVRLEEPSKLNPDVMAHRKAMAKK